MCFSDILRLNIVFDLNTMNGTRLRSIKDLYIVGTTDVLGEMFLFKLSVDI